MKAREIMTADVVTAKIGTRVTDIAAKMVEHRVSAIPIVDDEGILIGIVTESDLLHRKETGTERRRRWWVNILVDQNTRADDYIKAHGMHVEDIMTRVVVTVQEDAELGDIANILDQQRIRRVPVVREGRLIGIISRADLVRALAATAPDSEAQAIDDGELGTRVQEVLQAQSLVSTLYTTFTIRDGVVELSGFVDTPSQKRLLKVLVEEIPGVRRAEERLQLRKWHGVA